MSVGWKQIGKLEFRALGAAKGNICTAGVLGAAEGCSALLDRYQDKLENESLRTQDEE